ncbi:MAG: hypothetical protein JO117_09215 [Verrucomicrobia bacterium]|nr:hypothetical protein [Verrucomicrobiota bacterium]
MKLPDAAELRKKLETSELAKRLQTRSVLALTIESDCLLASVVRRVENTVSVAAGPLAVPVGAEEILRDPEKAGRVLAESLDSAGWRERRCVVAVPPGWALTASTELLEVSPEDLRGYLELRAEREFPIPVADLRLAHSAYQLADGKPRATLAAVPAKRLDAVTALLAVAGRRAVSISLALEHCFTQPSEATLHFLANGNLHTDVVVTAGGGVVALRSLSHNAGTPAGEDTTAAAFDPAGFCREVRITLGRLPTGVQAEVRQAHFGGATAAAQRLLEQTRAPLQKMGIEAVGDRGLPDDTDAGAGAAAETAGRVLRKAPVPFEFVVPEPKKWEPVLQRLNTKRRRWMAAAVAGCILLPVLIFFVRSRMESSYTREWEGMRNKVADLDVLQSKIRQFRPWFEPAPQNLQVLDGLISAFPEQGDVWAKSIQIGAGYKVTCTGFARNQPAWLGLLDRLRGRPDITALTVQQVRGDNPLQFSFTYKWEPRHEK